MLQDIKNPDIYLWNGIVGDYQDIKNISEVDLLKITFEDYVDRLECEEVRDGLRQRDQKYNEAERAEAKKYYLKNEKYEINQFVRQEHIDNGYYKSKKVHLIDAKIKNETSYGRGGNIDY